MLSLITGPVDLADATKIEKIAKIGRQNTTTSYFIPEYALYAVFQWQLFY